MAAAAVVARVPRRTALREVMIAILNIARNGSRWCTLHAESPPRSTIQYYFWKWRDNRTWHEASRELMAYTRVADGRATGTTAAVFLSQPVKATQSGCAHEFHTSQRVMGRIAHRIPVDAAGPVLGAAVYEAQIQDRDGAPSPRAEVGSGDVIFRGQPCLY